MKHFKHFLFLILLTSAAVQALPLQTLQNELNPKDQFELKWKYLIGQTDYELPIHYLDGKVVVGSQGKTVGVSDSFDGVYVMRAKDGKPLAMLKPNRKGITDIRGVASTVEAIYFTTSSKILYAFTTEGKALWSVELDQEPAGTPALCDVNSDDVSDVVLADTNGVLRIFDGNTGEIIWSYQAQFHTYSAFPESRAFIGSPTLVDTNFDGVRDIIIANRNGTLYAFNGKLGTSLWEYQTEYPSGVYNSTSYRSGEIVFAESFARIRQLNKKGRSSYMIPLDVTDYPSLFANVVSTPKSSLVIPAKWNNKRSGFWVLPQDQTSIFHPIGNISATPVVADLLGTGSPQIILITETGWMMLYSEQGKLLGRFSLPYGAKSTPLVADLDQDGTLELAIATLDGYFAVYGTKSKGSVYWGSLRGNPSNTGVYLDHVLSAKDKAPSNVEQYMSKHGYAFVPNLQVRTNMSRQNTEITDKSIGDAELGMTFQYLKTVLGDKARYETRNLEIGLNAIAVIWDEEVQYYILYPTWTTFKDEDVIKLLGTDNPKYVSKDGVGPGTQLVIAEGLYGAPILSYSQRKPFEERITFPKQSSQYWFANMGEKKMGIYESESTFNQTKRYKENAVIGFVGIKK